MNRWARTIRRRSEFRDVYSRYLESEPDLAAKAKARLKEMGLTVGTVARNAGLVKQSRDRRIRCGAAGLGAVARIRTDPHGTF